MAVTINNFWGAETGGLEESYASSGTVTVVNSPVRSGGFAYSLPNSTSQLDFAPFESVADAGGDAVAGFAYYLTSVTTTGGLCTLTDGTNTDFIVGINATGIYLSNTTGIVIQSTAGLTTSVWHWVEAWVQRRDSGSAELFVDGVSVGTCSAVDFNANTGSPIRLRFAGRNSNALHYDDIYFISGSTSAADRLSACEVFSYRSNLNSVTPDTGSNLNSGTWANAQEILFNDTNSASYTGTPLSGSVITNDVGGSAGTGGPKTDANITGSVLAMKGVWRASRGGGGGTTHTFYMGNDVDGSESFNQTLTTSPANYIKVSSNAGFVPAVPEYGRIGFGVSGGQDITVYDMLFQVLHTPSRFLPCNPLRVLMPALMR